MIKQRNEEKGRASLAIYRLPENRRDIRDFEDFLLELQCEVLMSVLPGSDALLEKTRKT